MRTDTDRLEFLQAQRFTKWVGYHEGSQVTTWPVYPGGNLRASIDAAMDTVERKPVSPTDGTATVFVEGIRCDE